MSTACIIPGIDGRAPRSPLAGGDCCSPSICNIDPCQLACQFVQLLPSGPLWDKQKRGALSALGQCGPAPECPPITCGTMAAAASNKASSLFAAIAGPMWRSLVEAKPETAFDTIDDWLSRLGWKDCFGATCNADLCGGDLTQSPFHCLGPTLPEQGRPGAQMSGDIGGQALTYVDPVYPEELILSVKRGIVIALHRARLRPIATADAINFVIAPLGAYVEPDGPTLNPWDNPADQALAAKRPVCPDPPIDCNGCAPGSFIAPEPPCYRWTPEIKLSVRNDGFTLPAVRRATFWDCWKPIGKRASGTECIVDECASVDASVFDPCTNRRIYPGVLAAVCVINSMLLRSANITIQHHGFNYARSRT